ncbi:hypothetical protein L3X38_040543 [Prunus dulcis]|uniref:AUGMIN subunit 8 n=1 Tax=Prunus dulcis TaxID=3755 RepID=A0AAD4V995_PRUDU|nr:hypothetical protein L3X38_040543 [Prunus dulcis]
MDAREPELAALKKPRPPLVPAEKNNAVTTRRPRTREISSRYKSPTPTPSTPSGTRRCPSPNLTRTLRPSAQLVSKRSQSVDRKRPSTPTSPPSPSTPVQDSSVDVQLSSRRTGNGRTPESLWPSTMRSLSVSFQSDTISIPVSKKEKPVTSALSDRTLRSSSNVAHRQAETPAPRKLTPERKRSPLKGKNAADQSENSKPVDGFHSRLIDHHRWPSRIGGKVSSNSLNRSVDLGAKIVRLATPVPGVGLSALRRLPTSDALGNKSLQKSSSDAAALLSLNERGRAGLRANLVDDNSLHVSGPHKLVFSSLSDRLSSTTPAVRSQSLPTTASRPSSPSKSSMFSSSVTRGLSPSRTRPSTPPSRGVSPSKTRSSNSCSQSSSSTSVLSFVADFKGKKGAIYIEDAHHLRLLYNRYLQWRFANARAETVLYIQKVTAERTLLNVWNTTLSLWDSVIRKRIILQQLNLELKLNSVLNDQMAYLDDWAVLESDHIAAFSGAMEDLEASTLRLPVTGGARADIDSLKVAICSAVDVMQAMASSICSLLSRVEGVNSLVSELAVVAAQEKVMLDECEALLASAAAMQVEEYSLRTHLIQMKQDLGSVSGQFWQPRQLLDPD